VDLRVALCKSSLHFCGVKSFADGVQVNWPKLNTPQWAIEAYEDTLNKVRKDPVVGRFVGGGKGDARLGTLEEGKKRRE